ncbi:hypothetical protein ACIQY8_31065 [Streptomyces albidoflavus]
MAALSPAAPTLYIEPAFWWRPSARTNFLDQNWEQDRNDRAQWHAPAVRGVLKKAAREGRVTSWPEIADKTGQH